MSPFNSKFFAQPNGTTAKPQQSTLAFKKPAASENVETSATKTAAAKAPPVEEEKTNGDVEMDGNADANGNFPSHKIQHVKLENFMSDDQSEDQTAKINGEPAWPGM